MIKKLYLLPHSVNNLNCVSRFGGRYISITRTFFPPIDHYSTAWENEMKFTCYNVLALSRNSTNPASNISYLNSTIRKIR